MLNPNERRSSQIQVTVTEGEAEQIRLAAVATERTVSDWVRNAAMNAVHQSQPEV